MTIIDVSEWQGVIDWNKAKPHIDGVILRCGCGTGYDDERWSLRRGLLERTGSVLERQRHILHESQKTKFEFLL